MKKSLLKPLQNERGIMTVDFIFSSLIVGGFFAIVFSLMLTLSVVEITQYITFATTRNYIAAHWSPEEQTALATDKYNQMIEDPIIAPLYRSGWFELDGPGIQDWNQVYSGTYDPSLDSDNFIGSRVKLTAKILEFNIPLIGSTSDLEDAFVANVASYLNREPTSTECYEFMNEQNRFAAIQQLDPSYRNGNVRNYFPMPDNGC